MLSSMHADQFTDPGVRYIRSPEDENRKREDGRREWAESLVVDRESEDDQ